MEMIDISRDFIKVEYTENWKMLTLQDMLPYLDRQACVAIVITQSRSPFDPHVASLYNIDTGVIKYRQSR